LLGWLLAALVCTMALALLVLALLTLPQVLAVLWVAFRLAGRLLLQQEAEHLLLCLGLLVLLVLLAQWKPQKMQLVCLALKIHTWQKLFKLAVTTLAQSKHHC
jgi:hypothetical protein